MTGGALSPTQEEALAWLRHPANAGRGLFYRGGKVPPATWDNLARRGLVTIEWVVVGARRDGIVTLAEQTP